MNRLRHPIRAIREPFGTAGLIVACVALMAALAGGAYAATGLNGKQKKEVEKIAKKYAGKPGAPGAAGPAGPQGAAGAAGANGKDGAAGAAGAAGKSVVVSEIEPEVEECEGRGGAEVKTEGSGSAVEVCTGEEGSPWTLGGNLPSGKTLTGVYTLRMASPGAEDYAPINFTLPLASAPTATYVEGASAAGCPGVVSGVATASPGNLCLYKGLQAGQAAEEEETKAILFVNPLDGQTIGFSGSSTGVAKTGTIFKVICGASNCTWQGTWAVTAA